jgi:cell division protein FtsB
MMAIRQTNEPVRLLWRRLGLLALFAFIILVGSGVWSAWQKDKESAGLNQQSQAALADLTAQESQLQGNITELQSDRGKEAALRQQYAVGKQGEDMIVIVDSSTTPPPARPSFLDEIKKAFSWW